MNYKAIYDSLIETRRNRKLDPNEYYEQHHILPKCLGGGNDKFNLVDLTAREHFVAHWLLYKLCKGDDKRKMACALHFMCYDKNQQQRNLTSRQYEIARKLHSKAMIGVSKSEETKQKLSEANSGENHPNYGKSHSEETKQKISVSSRGENHPLYGKRHNEESKQKMSESTTGENNPLYGKSHSEETRKKISKSNSGENHPMYGKKQQQIKCPHCGKIGGVNVMKRYHFDNCKYKKI